MSDLHAGLVDRLIATEAATHYDEAPPPGTAFFTTARSPSPVLISAPHGARTCRNDGKQKWHEEDEFTAGMALLLSEICRTSVIATTWRSNEEDPNYHYRVSSSYKQAVRRIVDTQQVRWVIDLHGASSNACWMPETCLVDLGTRYGTSLSGAEIALLEHLIEAQLGTGKVNHNGRAASREGRTITAYTHGELNCRAVQIEMKPAVRVACRRIDSSAYAEMGPYSADPRQVLGMLHALMDFIGGLTV